MMGPEIFGHLPQGTIWFRFIIISAAGDSYLIVHEATALFSPFDQTEYVQHD